MKKLISVILIILLLAAPIAVNGEDYPLNSNYPIIFDFPPESTEGSPALMIVYGNEFFEFKPDEGMDIPIEGLFYDNESHICTLDNIRDKGLYLMFFKLGDVELNINGDCEICSVSSYAGDDMSASLHLSGDGSLTLSDDSDSIVPLLYIEANGTKSTVTIDSSLSLKVNGDISFGIHSFGEKNPKEPVFKAGGKAIPGIKALTTKSDKVTKRGVFIPGYEKNVGIKMLSKNDPDGIYGAKTWYSGFSDKISGYEIYRYIYSEALEAYVVDSEFEPLKLKPEQLESNGFERCLNVPKNIIYLKTYYPTDRTNNGWNEGYKVINPDDPEGTYVLTGNLYDNTIYRYGLAKYSYNEEKKTYDLVKEYPTANRNELIDFGFKYVYGEDNIAEKIITTDSPNQVVYRISNPDEPDAVYGTGLSDKDKIPEYTLRKVYYSEENSRYEIDRTFNGKTYTKEEFEKSGLTYDAKDKGDEELYLNLAEIENYTLMSKNGAYALSNGTRYLYSESGKVDYNGEELTRVRKNIALDREEYEPVYTETELEYPHFYLDGAFEYAADNNTDTTASESTASSSDENSQTGVTTEPMQTSSGKDETSASTESTEPSSAKPSDATIIEPTEPKTEETDNSQTESLESAVTNPEPTAETETTAPTTTKHSESTDINSFSKGADAKKAENAILKLKSDKDPKGTRFSILQAKAKSVKKKSVKLKWKKVKGAVKYIVFANRCGKAGGKFNAYKKLKVLKKTSLKAVKINGKKLKKNSYYKFLVMAVDKSGKVITVSKTVHTALAGGKYTNPKKITMNRTKLTIKKGEKFKHHVKIVFKNKKLKNKTHRAVKFETSSSNVKVSNKGVITALKKGATYVYAYAQNGVFGKLKVTVK